MHFAIGVIWITYCYLIDTKYSTNSKIVTSGNSLVDFDENFQSLFNDYNAFPRVSIRWKSLKMGECIHKLGQNKISDLWYTKYENQEKFARFTQFHSEWMRAADERGQCVKMTTHAPNASCHIKHCTVTIFCNATWYTRVVHTSAIHTGDTTSNK